MPNDTKKTEQYLKKSDKNPKGGLSASGRKRLNKETGSNLKPGVKNYSNASPPDKRRWISWASRHYGPNSRKKPYKDKDGEPTRHALQANAWGESVPKNQSDAAKIYQKAQKRKKILDNKEKKK